MSTQCKPHEEAIRFANDLARASSCLDARAVVQQWRLAATSATARRRQGRADGVGIWRRTVVDGAVVFIRQRDDGEPLMWAQTESIGPKDGRKRVVLLGESAARGWPLDPLFTCASCLSAHVRHLQRHNEIEIVDLANCGLDARGLVQLAQEAAVLEPDAYIVFAGNNWAFELSKVDFEPLTAALRKTSRWPSVAALLERAYRAQIDDILASLDRVLRPQRVPVLFVIPGCNLRDWQAAPRGHHPLVTAADQRRARVLTDEGYRLLAAGHVEQASRTADALSELEDGFSAMGLDLAARCALGRGDNAAAVKSFETSGDIGLSILVPPFNAASVRIDALRRRASSVAASVVDVPRRLIERNDGAPPGREFFLDHVHMTAKGIRVAMAAVLEQLLQLLQLPSAPAETIEDCPVHVEPRAVAQAHFAAALKASRGDQPTAAIRHHCVVASEASPAILAVVRDYVLRSVLRAPDVFCGAFHRLRAAETQFPVLRHFLALPPHRPKPLNVDLAMSLIETLRGSMPDAAAECERLLYRERAVTDQPIDLRQEPGTDTPGGALARARFGIVGPSTLACYEPLVSFLCVCAERPRRFHVEITSRVPYCCRPTDSIAIIVNGVRRDSWSVSAKWRTVHRELDPACLVRGANTLTIVWPDPNDSQEQRLEHAVRSLESWGFSSLEPAPGGRLVYGEIERCLVFAEPRSAPRPAAQLKTTNDQEAVASAARGGAEVPLS